MEPFISIFGIFIFNFPFPFGTLTPTLTSGINKLCLFNIIGASIISLNIVLIFNGALSDDLPLIFCSQFILGISIFGLSISMLVPTLDIFNFPSTFGIPFLSRLISKFGIFPSIFCPILISGISIFSSFISKLGIFISNFPFDFGILTPTLTSGINKLCLFNIIGSSTLPLNIFLIFIGDISGIFTF